MEKLDVKDRKILYELDIDSRQSFSQLGKKVGLHKDIVSLRVQKLQEKRIIKNFYTQVCGNKLGYTYVKFYLTYQNVTPKIKQEIIDYLVQNPYTLAVHSCGGHYDLCVCPWVENITNFSTIWNNIIGKYKDYFSSQVFCVHNLQIKYKLIFLLDEKPDKKEERILSVDSSDYKKVEIDELDKKILDLLALNSRISTVEIAQKLKSNVTEINSRVTALVKKGVIIRFTINIDWPKIGYEWYKADITLKKPEKRQQIIEYIENNPNLIHRIASLGYVDLELTFILNNAIQLHQILEDLSLKFPDAIQNYKYFSIINTHKYFDIDFWNR